jgi:hypothetical protein
MPTSKKAVTAYLTPEEFSEVKGSASRAGLSLSTYLRMVSRGQPVKSLEHQRERMEMRRFRGELARLGGLLKQVIAAGYTKEQVNPLLRRLDRCLFDLQALIRRI